MTAQSGAANLATHPRRARALELMLEGRSDREIAKELGCEPSTVWRWRVDPGFASELRTRQHDRLAAMGARLDALSASAIEVIAGLMNDTEQPAMLRLRAAAEILDRAAWSGGGQERRVRAEVAAEVARFTAAIAERCSAETYAELVKALTEPLPEGVPEKKARRPHVVVTFQEDDE